MNLPYQNMVLKGISDVFRTASGHQVIVMTTSGGVKQLAQGQYSTAGDSRHELYQQTVL